MVLIEIAVVLEAVLVVKTFKGIEPYSCTATATGRASDIPTARTIAKNLAEKIAGKLFKAVIKKYPYIINYITTASIRLTGPDGNTTIETTPVFIQHKVFEKITKSLVNQAAVSIKENGPSISIGLTQLGILADIPSNILANMIDPLQGTTTIPGLNSVFLSIIKNKYYITFIKKIINKSGGIANVLQTYGAAAGATRFPYVKKIITFYMILMCIINLQQPESD
jgi:hypothetical protein